jgi:hypothetical protein
VRFYACKYRTGFVRPYFHRFCSHRAYYPEFSGQRIRTGNTITPQVFSFGAPRGTASQGAVGFVLLSAAFLRWLSAVRS